MKNFDFLYGTMLGEMVLHHTDNLSRNLQDKMCSAAEGQQIAAMVIHTLQSLRNDDSFDLFWSRVTNTVILLILSLSCHINTKFLEGLNLG